MSTYRRFYTENVWFFTLLTHRRKPLLTHPQVQTALRQAIMDCRHRYPFEIDAWVLLPEHLHCIWRLPDIDLDYSRRWSIIKRLCTQSCQNIAPDLLPLWQKRFWAHAITSDEDYLHHMNYVHYNPVKHGLVKRVCEWEWSSFHRLVRSGVYTREWGSEVDIAEGTGKE